MSDAEKELLIVPHTHWDREWYLTYQQFRMKLVDTVDAVLDTLESDPTFSFFMLDGQTIVLEDYLEIRPENAARLQALAQEGRILVGPWYLQPDEFLVGGESLIRNLQLGLRMAEPYGGAMLVGYVPDTFGHIAQIPQLLRGFNIETAAFWRGVLPEVDRDAFYWQAPDGSEVLVSWLHDEFGYSNANRLPLDAEALATRIRLTADRMQARTTTDMLLLMNGSDHLLPQTGLPASIAAANERLRDDHLHLRIGTLPQYLAYLKEANPALQTYKGEMRSSYSAHLLPGVYSSRTWLKQRNAAVEALLTRWAEPTTSWAWLAGEPYPATLMQLAWKFLMHNHPHDSICGCSIDQVHAEMMPRFAQSEQIATELTNRALKSLARKVQTTGPEGCVPVVAFNPTVGPRSDTVQCQAQIPFSPFEIVDERGVLMPHQVIAQNSSELLRQTADKAIVLGMLGIISEGHAFGYTILTAHIGQIQDKGIVPIELSVAEQGTPNLPLIERVLQQVRELAEQEEVTGFDIVAHEAQTTDFAFLARDIPAFGGRTFFVQPAHALDRGTNSSLAGTSDASALQSGQHWIENAYLRVAVESTNGTIQIQDKLTGQVYSGLNRFMDGGDVGDLYTYCPPMEDSVITQTSEPPVIEMLEQGPARMALHIRQIYSLPANCSEDRSSRSTNRVPCAITTVVTLNTDSRRVECRTTVENAAKDHRLRVLFPVPFTCEMVDVEGTFEVTRRLAEYPQPKSGQRPWSEWFEVPVNTHPHKRFADLSDEAHGLAILNRGLPEYEVIQTEEGSVFALTLLRCTGWLSRDDLITRRGHAGPPLPTPEAQAIGKYTFEYALVPHSGTWHAQDAFVLQEAQAYEAPQRVVVTDQHAGMFPATWSFVGVTPSSVVLSTVKRAESGAALIIRVYNPLADQVEATVTLAEPFGNFDEVTSVDLTEEGYAIERTAALTTISDSGVRLLLRGGEIHTLRFRRVSASKE